MGEAVANHREKRVLQGVEYFQNNFIRHNKIIDILKHDINLHEQKLGKYDETLHLDVDHKGFKDHSLYTKK